MDVIQDRELAAVDPWVFADARAAGTILAEGSAASLASQQLSNTGSVFADVGVKAGSVIVVNGEVMEVAARINQTTLRLSKVRADAAEAEIPPPNGSALPFHITTFARIIAAEQARVLASLRLDGDGSGSGDGAALAESALIDEAPLRALIIVRSIAAAYEQAAAQEPDDASLAARATLWRSRAREQAERSATGVDADGDGVTEGTRRVDVIVLRRS